MKKNVLIAGPTGMIGNIVLRHCLTSDKIENVISISRRKSGVVHTKLIEVIHNDFTNYHILRSHFKNIDIAYFCIGVYTGKVPDSKFKEITVDYTKAFVDVLKDESPDATFCFLSGAGADRTEKSRTSFAKYKGMAENYLISKQLKRLYLFRPAYIYPDIKRKEPNLMYRIFRRLYPIIKLFGKNASIRSSELGRAIFISGLYGAEKTILENKDILQILN